MSTFFIFFLIHTYVYVIFGVEYEALYYPYDGSVTGATFDAVTITSNTVFKAPFPGRIDGIRLEYVSGGVVNYVGGTETFHWGSDDTRLGVNVIKRTTSPYTTLYPISSTSVTCSLFLIISNT